MKRAMLIALSLFFLTGVSAQGQTTIFSNFNTSVPLWDYYMGYAIGTTITGGNYGFAAPFTIQSPQYLYSFELPVWFESSSGQPQGIIVSINESAEGTLEPGGTLESIQYPGPFPTSNTSGTAIIFNSSRHPLLTDGNTYWIVAKTVDATLPTGQDTYIWNQNNTGGTGGCESYDRGTNWSCNSGWTTPAVNVSGVPGTPEAGVQLLIDDVRADLEPHVATSLVAILSSVLRSLDSANDNAALRVLLAFIDVVSAQRGKRIPAPEADDMIALASSIAEQIQAR